MLGSLTAGKFLMRYQKLCGRTDKHDGTSRNLAKAPKTHKLNVNFTAFCVT